MRECLKHPSSWRMQCLMAVSEGNRWRRLEDKLQYYFLRLILYLRSLNCCEVCPPRRSGSLLHPASIHSRNGLSVFVSRTSLSWRSNRIFLFVCFFFFVSSRLARNEDDEEEAARERRRRARQERLMSRESEEPSGQTDSVVTANSHRWHRHTSAVTTYNLLLFSQMKKTAFLCFSPLYFQCRSWEVQHCIFAELSTNALFH